MPGIPCSEIEAVTQEQCSAPPLGLFTQIKLSFESSVCNASPTVVLKSLSYKFDLLGELYGDFSAVVVTPNTCSSIRSLEIFVVPCEINVETSYKFSTSVEARNKLSSDPSASCFAEGQGKQERAVG